MNKNQDKPWVMVTGAAGALAQSVIQKLQKNYRIVAVDFRKKVDFLGEHPSYRVDFTKRNFEDLFRTYPFSSVIHLGRIISSEETRHSRYNANVLGTQRLFELSHKYGVENMVVLSTFHVYGANAYNPALIDESAPLKAAELTMDLVDSVELENLANIYLWKHPDLHITILRPCNIVGPGVRNAISSLLSSRLAPVLMGFSPVMQFIHIDDMANAIVLAHKKKQAGIFNVAPNDWIDYQSSLDMCGCRKLPLFSIPPIIPRLLTQYVDFKGFPPYLLNYFKYPVVIDGRVFSKTFNHQHKYSLSEIFDHYRLKKMN